MMETTGHVVLPSSPAMVKRACADTSPLEPRASYTFGHWAVVLVRSGSGTIDHAGHRFAIESGTLICSPPGFVTVDLSLDSDVTVVALEERAPAARAPWRPFAVPLVRRLSPDEVADWAQRLALIELKIAAAHFGDADIWALNTSLMERFWLAARPAAQRVVNETFDALERELGQIDSLDDLASSVGYTRNHLSDVMRELTGASLGTWLTGMRMARARHALVSEEIPIASLGAQIGYEDAAYFSRAFRRYHGVPPHIWRIAHRPDDLRHASVVVDEPKAVQAVA